MSTAFPQPAPGSVPSAGPTTVPADRLRQVLGVTSVNFTAGNHHLAIARMTMRPVSEAEIEAYLTHAGEAVTSSVGAYQLEGLGVHLFERIEGDHFTILGLPLLPLFSFLRSEKLLAI